MATVFLARLRGPEGFYRLVAAKRAHAHLLGDPEVRRMFVQEAKLAARIHHTNVVSVLDIEEQHGELLLAQEYVEGPSLSQLLKHCGAALPPAIAARIVLDACWGLAAAHELQDADGVPLGVVHRDVSPHNVLVGRDGVTKLTDFGIAKVLHAGEEFTSAGVIKGKLGYMAPEYVLQRKLDTKSDVFSMGVVLWECLAGRRLFRGNDEEDTLKRIATAPVPRLADFSPQLEALDDVIHSAVAKDPSERFASASALATALEAAVQRAHLAASHGDVADFVRAHFGDELKERRRAVEAVVRALAQDPTRTHTAAELGLVESEASGSANSMSRSDPSSASALGVEQLLPKSEPRSRALRFGLVSLGFGIAVVVGLFIGRTRDRVEPSANAVSAAAGASTTVREAAASAASSESVPTPSARGEPPLASAEPSLARAEPLVAPEPVAAAPARQKETRVVGKPTPTRKAAPPPSQTTPQRAEPRPPASSDWVEPNPYAAPSGS